MKKSPGDESHIDVLIIHGKVFLKEFLCIELFLKDTRVKKDKYNICKSSAKNHL